MWVEGENGEKLSVLFKLAPQNVLGNGAWPIGVTPEARIKENLEDLQIPYPLTSYSTVDNPTGTEESTIFTFDQMWSVTFKDKKILR